MSEEKNLIVNVNDSLGEIAITPGAVEVITEVATSEVEDVYGIHNTFANNVNELLSRVAHGKGVYLQVEEEGLEVDVYCYLSYGVSVPRVTLEM